MQSSENTETAGTTPRSPWGGAVRLGLSLAFVGAIVWWADPSEVWSLLRDASIIGVGAVIALHMLDRVLMAYKWWRLLRVRDFDVKFGDAVRGYFLGSFIGAVIPFTGGADLARIAAVRGKGANTEALIASVALERALGAVSHLVFCVGAVAMLVAWRIDMEVSATALAGAAIGALVLLTALLPLSFAVAERFAARPESEGLAGRLVRLAGDYAAWRAHPRELWIFLALTFVEGFYPILGYWIAAQALGLDVTLVQTAIAVPLAFLVARLPIPTFSMGPEQLGFFWVATRLGIPEAAATAITVLFLGTILIAFTPGALAWMNSRRD
ncbi:MAG: hypothetical protein GKS06_10795 [Acidobacteria bacterium]|nr:hypothetical protein [Acidobacteriota bacterium]